MVSILEAYLPLLACAMLPFGTRAVPFGTLCRAVSSHGHCSRGVAHNDADLRLTHQWPSLPRLLRLSTNSETGLRQLFMIELDKRLEQQQRAAGHANAADEKLDLFLKRRANLFNLGAPLVSAYPSIDTRPADSVGDRMRVRLSAFLQAGSTQRFPPCSTRVRRCRHG